MSLPPGGAVACLESVDTAAARHLARCHQSSDARAAPPDVTKEWGQRNQGRGIGVFFLCPHSSVRGLVLAVQSVWLDSSHRDWQKNGGGCPSLGRQKSLVDSAPTSRARFARIIDGPAIHFLTYREQNRAADHQFARWYTMTGPENSLRRIHPESAP